jgi:GDP-4-dehydro-6-deoxy-D-mannose reductase
VKVLVTGSTGFVGRWMVDELTSTGHALAGAPGDRVEVTDAEAIASLVDKTRPDGVIHLAGVAFGPDARRDPATAARVNTGGTVLLLQAVAKLEQSPCVLVIGSSDVYGAPDPHDLPLSEKAPTHPTSPYGRSKLGQEEAALAAARAGSARIAVTRSFNHTGPGQRAEFVAPALARRVLAARDTHQPEIPVGNLDVRRDFGDVRDFVRAYRLILEGLAAGTIPTGSVLNVATGRSVAIREVLATLADIAGVRFRPYRDPALIRGDDPPEIVGDASRLRDVTGWRPSIPLRRTLADLVASIEAGR